MILENLFLDEFDSLWEALELKIVVCQLMLACIMLWGGGRGCLT